MLAARLLECLFLPSCVTVFVLMDCCVVGAPRARCALGLTLLSQLFTKMYSTPEYCCRYVSSAPAASS